MRESLGKTWFVDVDGTILYHQTDEALYQLVKKYGRESYLFEKPIKKAIDYFKSLPKTDVIVITTARNSYFKNHTIKALEYFGMPFKHTVFDIGSGPRVIVNDIKPVGVVDNKFDLTMAYSVNVKRDSWMASGGSWSASEECLYVQKKFKREMGD